MPGALYGIFGHVPGLEKSMPLSLGAVGFASWCLFGLLYLLLTAKVFSRADAGTLTLWLQGSTPRTRTSRLWQWVNGGSGTSWATQVAVIAVLIVLSISFTPESRSSLPIMMSGFSAIAGSWLLILAALAVQYARTDAIAKGLAFPGDDPPLFSDYFYFAVQVSTSYSVADVVVMSRDLRRIVTYHSLIAFAFNTVIIAILVSALLAAAV